LLLYDPGRTRTLLADVGCAAKAPASACQWLCNDSRQPATRIGAAGFAKRVARHPYRSDHQERTCPDLVRRNA
jgi:hypothetical protein